MRATFKLLLLVFLTTSSYTVLSGQVKQGDLLFSQQQYEAAIAAYKRVEEDGRDKVMALFSIGKIYAEESFSESNLDSAYYYIRQGQRKYGRLSSGDKKKMEKAEMSSSDMSKLRNNVAEQALAIIDKNPSLKKYDQFIEYYDRCRTKTKEAALASRNTMVGKAINKATRYSQLKALQDTYGEAIRYKMETEYALLQDKLFRSFLADNGFNKFNDYAKVFPESPYVTDRGKVAFMRTQGTNNPTAFSDFIRYFPNSLYTPYAKDSLQVLSLIEKKKTQNPTEILASLKTTTDSLELEVLDKDISANLGETYKIQDLEKALEGAPIRQLRRTMDKVYGYYKAQNTKEALTTFKQKYPLYHQIRKVNNDLRQIELVANRRNQQIRQLEENIKAYAPDYAAFISLQRIIAPNIKDKNWDEAIKTVEKYKPDFKGEVEKLDNLIGYLKAESSVESLELLGNSKINTTAKSEYSPIVSADGQELYFCRDNGVQGRPKEEIYVAQLANNEWGTPRKVAEFTGSKFNFAPSAISIDGTRFVMFKGSSRGLIVYSDKTKKGWSEIQEFNDNINSAQWQCFLSIASNNQVMIFEARRRPDAVASRKKDHIDLYVSKKDENGDWGPAFNIGEVINTGYNERTPFLHPDMRTLYFSSDGQGGFGGLDVYKTTRLDDTWTKWSEPEHLGKGINTQDNDWGYKISTDGTTAYFAAAPGGDRKFNLYQVELPQELRPQLVSTITLTVLDENGNPLEAQVVLEDLSKGEQIGDLKTAPDNGRAFAALPHESLYSYVVTKDGYFPVSNNIDLVDVTEAKNVEEVVQMKKISELVGKDEAVRLNNLFFDTDKSVIKKESYPELDRVKLIIVETNTKILIQGHTDAVGSAQYNQKLSQDRANAVKAYLIKNGVPANLVEAKGFGESNPVADNETEEGKAQNRRVEIKFLGN
ncbi:MAG: OmpA family protein [Bacteroidota bacterium]